jgi:DNA polymerase-1
MKLLLIDGYSLLFRAFYSSPSLTTKSGKPTGALYGFVRMVLRLLDEVTPEYCLVALDAKGPTFRHDSFEAYKAHRVAAPDDLQTQIGLARELLDGLSIPHYEHVGFEADDILGTLACIGAREKLDVTIVTGDGDALQLVNDRVSVMLTRKGVSDLECFTPEAVRAKYSFDAALVPDYKGLRGDSSDNIPGVPGIGEKTAIKLISQFGALENVFEKIEEVTPARIRDLLKEHREIALKSRELARIVTDLPLDIPLEHARLPQMDEARRERALETVREFEFKSLIRRYAKSAEADSGASTPAEDEEELRELSTRITRAATFEEVRAWFKTNRALQDGASFIFHANRAALACGEEALVFTGALEDLKEWLEDESPKIVHDAKVQKLELCKREIALGGVVADTMLMSYLLEPARQQHPLSTLARKQLSCELPEIEPPVEKKSASKKKASESLFEESTPEAEAAAREAEIQETARLEDALAQCAVATSLLEPILRAELQGIGEEQLFEQLELPLVDILVSMEQIGMLLDPVELQRLGKELEAEANRLQAEIWQLAGEEFNVGSPKQLQVILFEKLGLEKGRTTKSGYSTDVHTLERLAEEHDIVRKILEYRGTTKLKSTYVDALLAGMEPRTHRVHTSLNQTGAVSGRLSSSNPNLQNIPIRTEQGRHIRRTFIAPPGHVLLKADYSQIELRILAHITGDDPLVEAFRAGADVHARTAADLFAVKIEEVDAEMRRKAKMTNYAIAYGVSGFGLAKQLGTGTPGEGQEIIRKYFEALPGVKKYMDDILEEARREGYVKTLMGRRRPLPEINSPRGPERAAAERTAINHPVQGTAADIMKIAMLAVFREMKKRQLRSRMVLQVHDELVFEVPHDEVRVLAPIVRELMCDVPTQKIGLSVPLEVDVSTGQNWNDTEELE